MVSPSAPLMAAALLAGVAVAAVAEPLRVRSVEAVRPTEFVVANAPETREACARLRPSAKRLRAWFARARETPQAAWLEEGDQSACRVSGVLVTARGGRHAFELGAGGMARVDIGGGAFTYLLGPELPLPR